MPETRNPVNMLPTGYVKVQIAVKVKKTPIVADVVAILVFQNRGPRTSGSMLGRQAALGDPGSLRASCAQPAVPVAGS